MNMPLVAFSRKLDAIDLTASLWLARLDETTASSRRRILWVADPRGSYNGVQDDLEALARVMSPAFDIEVISYSAAWERSSYKNPIGLFYRLRDEVAGSTGRFPCRVRIHHGSLDVNCGGHIIRAHCLEFRTREDDEFGVSASGRPGSWTTASPQDITGISGSLHLYLAGEIGEVVNLPWYALTPLIWPIVVRETISPVAFYSADRYSDGGIKLRPMGYSLIDYPNLSAPAFTRKVVMPSASEINAYSLLMTDYPRTSARIGPRAPGSAELVSNMYSLVRRRVLAGKIPMHISNGTLTSDIPAGDIINSMLVTAVAARVLENVDRGHGAAVPPALVDALRASGMLDTDRLEQVGILLRTHAQLLDASGCLLRTPREIPRPDAACGRFGEIARLCIVSATACAEVTLLDLAVRLKASVPALVSILDGNGCALSFDSLAKARTQMIAVPVSGSILSYAD
ncbi:hypothetical protein [Streptomyces sp. NPDC088350]|uniref:hypothetical protein n=1 Tax=Streptomyces sp. NPDC088350 TaxID=3365854 RepID=UPI0037FC1F5B